DPDRDPQRTGPGGPGLPGPGAEPGRWRERAARASPRGTAGPGAQARGRPDPGTHGGPGPAARARAGAAGAEHHRPQPADPGRARGPARIRASAPAGRPRTGGTEPGDGPPGRRDRAPPGA